MGTDRSFCENTVFAGQGIIVELAYHELAHSIVLTVSWGIEIAVAKGVSGMFMRREERTLTADGRPNCEIAQ